MRWTQLLRKLEKAFWKMELNLLRVALTAAKQSEGIYNFKTYKLDRVMLKK